MLDQTSKIAACLNLASRPLQRNTQGKASTNENRKTSRKLRNKIHQQQKIHRQKPTSLAQANTEKQIDKNLDGSSQLQQHCCKDAYTNLGQQRRMNLDQDRRAKVNNGNDSGSAGLHVRSDESAGTDRGSQVGTELGDQVGNDVEVSDDGDGDVGVDFGVNGCVNLGGWCVSISIPGQDQH